MPPDVYNVTVFGTLCTGILKKKTFRVKVSVLKYQLLVSVTVNLC